VHFFGEDSGELDRVEHGMRGMKFYSLLETGNFSAAAVTSKVGNTDYHDLSHHPANRFRNSNWRVLLLPRVCLITHTDPVGAGDTEAAAASTGSRDTDPASGALTGDEEGTAVSSCLPNH
jgi:hypothetical protein